MADQGRSYYYRAVPGSRELTTSSRADDELLARIEKAAAEKPAPQREYQGEWLGGAVFGEGLAVPASVFDMLLPEQSPLEQALYMHLFRLSYGEGLNFCRVGKRELMNRTRTSDRRLNVALDGLVRKGHLKPLHRNTEGTLYRVYLPSEALETEPEKGFRPGPKIEEPQAKTRPETTEETPTKTKAQPRKPRSRSKPVESPLNEEKFSDLSGEKPKGPSLAELADRFFKARGLTGGPRQKQIAATVLTELLEDGYSRKELQKALEWFVINLPEEPSLERLPYYINQALEDSG